MDNMEIIKMKKELSGLQEELKKRLAEIDNFKSSMEQLIEQKQKFMVIRQEKFEEKIENVLKQELDKIHEGHETITGKVEEHVDNVTDLEQMLRDIKNTGLLNKQKIQILAEEIEEILNEMDKKIKEKNKEIEELRRYAGLAKKPEKKEKIVEEIGILKKIEQRLASQKEPEEEGLLEKIHLPFVATEEEDKKLLSEKYIQMVKKAEKKDEYAIEIAHIVREFVQKKLNIRSELTYSELLERLEKTEKIEPEVKKQLMEFFNDVVKKEYANEDIKFPKPNKLSSWAQEIIKVLEEEYIIEDKKKKEREEKKKAAKKGVKKKKPKKENEEETKKEGEKE